jgi:hypothetical protein
MWWFPATRFINTGKAKAGKSLERLLKVPDLDLTITVGRDA